MDDAPRPQESDASEAGEALPLASEASDEARPSWTAPLIGAATGAAGGALGFTLAVGGGVLGGVAALAAGGALVTVSRAWRHNSGEAVEMEGEEVQVTNVQVTNVPQEAIANDPNGSNGSNDLRQNQSHQSQHGESQSYAEGLLMERSLMERLRLLQQLHNRRDEASLQQMCATEGLAWLGANSMGCFVRRHGEQSEVFFLGSEADFQSRPEEFTSCWLHTNAHIQLQPLDAAICHDMIPGAHVHTGFQSSYLSIADELLGALREATGPLCIVGYSLGGALGTLAALQLCCRGFTQIDLITFGSPRVGNESFRDCFTERCLRPNYVRMARYVNTLDIVPHVPFNPEDVDSTRQGQLWRRVEEALTIPQQQLTGGSSSDHGNYVHVVPPTVLDGLSSSVAGVVSRLASIAAESERLRMAAAVPIEIVAEHGLSKYVCTLQEASRPAWLCLSNRLLAAGSPMHNALLEFQARRVQNSVAVNPSWGIAMASGAAEATSAGIAGLLLPQLLSSAVCRGLLLCGTKSQPSVRTLARTHSGDSQAGCGSSRAAVFVSYHLYPFVFVRMLFYLPAYLYGRLSVGLATYLYLSITCLSICLSTCLSVSLFIFLTPASDLIEFLSHLISSYVMLPFVSASSFFSYCC